MNLLPSEHAYLAAYYCVYLGLCAALILGLGKILHRSGSVFLNDAFEGNTALVQAVARLLDVGFYLVSIGYVGVSYRTVWQMVDSYGAVIGNVTTRLGGFLLLLGFAHLFNLLLLAIFRQRGSKGNRAPAA